MAQYSQQQREAHRELKSLHFDFERMIARHDTATLQHPATTTLQRNMTQQQCKTLK